MNSRDCSFFQSFQVVLSLAPWSFLPHAHTDQYSAKASREILPELQGAFGFLFFMLLPLPGTLPAGSSHSGQPGHLAPFAQSKETLGLPVLVLLDAAFWIPCPAAFGIVTELALFLLFFFSGLISYIGSLMSSV